MTADLDIKGREAIADWIETTLLVRDGAQLGLGALQEMARAEVHAAAPQLELALGVMRRRAELLGSGYPFEVHEWAVRAVPGAAATPYAALVLLTPGGAARHIVHSSPSTETAVVFEQITERAVARLWGSEGRAIRFGWPSDVGRPPEFPLAVPWLAAKLGLQAGVGYRPPRRKDGGVDVVGWRPFPDGRSGFPIVLVQCTLQTDIVAKSRDVDARLWASWLVMDEEPATALAVPQTIPTGVLWDELALNGAVFERMRLSGLTAAGPYVPGLEDWVRSTLTSLRPLLVGAET
jgi:hypothetical protein